jgi:hypothetical protein
MEMAWFQDLKLYSSTALCSFSIFFSFYYHYHFSPWSDNDRTTTQTPKPGLDVKKVTPETELLRLKLYCI